MNEKIRNLMVRASECREAVMNADGAGEADKIPSLREAAKNVEKELREALTEDDDDAGTIIGTTDAETRERLEIRSRATVGGYVTRALTGEPLDGAEAEYAAAWGCPGSMPIDMLMPETREVETRAVTPGQDTPAGTMSPIPYVFERTIAARLGVAFPSVPAGAKYYPVLGTAPPAGAKAKGASADSTAAAFTLANRVPKRITGAFEIQREDIAVMPGMEEALRSAIGDSMGHSLDNIVVNEMLTTATDVTAAGSVEDFATGVARFAGIVDGRYANGFGDLRACIGVNTFAKYAGLFQSNGDVSLFDYLMSKLNTIIVSKRVPALASKAQKGIVVRTRGSQILEVPLWNGISLIRDEFTKAAEGAIIVTAYMLAGALHAPYTTNTLVEVHPKLVA